MHLSKVKGTISDKIMCIALRYYQNSYLLFVLQLYAGITV